MTCCTLLNMVLSCACKEFKSCIGFHIVEDMEEWKALPEEAAVHEVIGCICQDIWPAVQNNHADAACMQGTSVYALWLLWLRMPRGNVVAEFKSLHADVSVTHASSVQERLWSSAALQGVHKVF